MRRSRISKGGIFIAGIWATQWPQFIMPGSRGRQEESGLFLVPGLREMETDWNGLRVLKRGLGTASNGHKKCNNSI